ncbi:MAG: YesL family protein [Erysipelotrichaceae bacterium]|nr:YesL family protein [Erysipelotrichaceae bacterium]
MFKQEGIIYRFFDLLANLTILNICFIIGSLPIITIGTSLSAMYSVAFKLVDDNSPKIISEFIKSYKNNFKQSTLIWVGCLIFGFGMLFNIFLFYGSDTILFQIYRVAMVVLLILLLCFIIYVFAIVSKYENNLNNLFKVTLYLIFTNFFKTVVMICVVFLAFFISFINPFIYAWAIFVYITFGFSLICYTLANILNGVFKSLE